MKWDKPTGAVQYSADRAYCTVEAATGKWVSYELGPATGKDLGTTDTEERARALCEQYENSRRRV